VLLFYTDGDIVALADVFASGGEEVGLTIYPTLEFRAGKLHDVMN